MRTDGDLWCTIIILLFFFFTAFRFAFMAFPKMTYENAMTEKKKKISEGRYRYESVPFTAWPLLEPLRVAIITDSNACVQCHQVNDRCLVRRFTNGHMTKKNSVRSQKKETPPIHLPRRPVNSISLVPIGPIFSPGHDPQKHTQENRNF